MLFHVDHSLAWFSWMFYFLREVVRCLTNETRHHTPKPMPEMDYFYFFLKCMKTIQSLYKNFMFSSVFFLYFCWLQDFCFPDMLFVSSSSLRCSVSQLPECFVKIVVLRSFFHTVWNSTTAHCGHFVNLTLGVL